MTADARCAGLELHPENAELLAGLKAARVAVLDGLLTLEDEDEDEDASAAENASLVIVGRRSAQASSVSSSLVVRREVETEVDGPPPPSPSVLSLGQKTQDERRVTGRGSASRAATVFEAKLERVLGHLDLKRLAHLALVFVTTELLSLRRVSAGLALVFLALLFQMAMHRHKLMVVSMLAVCFYRSELKAKALQWADHWARTSTDKLGAFTWMPRVIVAIPVCMKIFGHVKFMLFLHQDVMLTVLVTMVTGALVTNSKRSNAGPQAISWSQGRRLKFAAYTTAIAYWAGYRGNFIDTLRLVAPALIDAAGIVLGSVTPEELQGVFRRAWKRLYAEVAEDITEDVELDALFILGLGNWVIEYWQQPTDFSIEMLARMLAESFAKLERAAVAVFRPELNHLGRQMADLHMNSELALLVKYLKQSLEGIPPPRSVGTVGLFAQRCPSFIACAILLVFSGVISLPLVPFMAAEASDARYIYEMHRNGELEALDGLEIWLLGSPLVRVWGNLKACIYCLEGTVTLSRAVATGTQIATTAARIRCVTSPRVYSLNPLTLWLVEPSRLATFASQVKEHGFAAHAGSIPDQLEHVWTIAQDARSVAWISVLWLAFEASLRADRTRIMFTG